MWVVICVLPVHTFRRSAKLVGDPLRSLRRTIFVSSLTPDTLLKISDHSIHNHSIHNH